MASWGEDALRVLETVHPKALRFVLAGGTRTPVSRGLFAEAGLRCGFSIPYSHRLLAAAELTGVVGPERTAAVGKLASPNGAGG